MKKIRYLIGATICLTALLSACGDKTKTQSDTSNPEMEITEVDAEEVTPEYAELDAPDISDYSSLASEEISTESSDDYDDSETPAAKSSSSATTAKSGTSASSNNWDEVLDAYEKCVNSYAKVMKKVQAGTLEVTSPEYLKYVQETAELTGKLDGAKSDMTPAQMARYSKITMKMAATQL